MSYRKLRAYVCVDCNPEHDLPGQESGYDDSFMLALNDGIERPEYCPRCGGHLGLDDAGMVVVMDPALFSRVFTDRP
jgi:hypothetical protein